MFCSGADLSEATADGMEEGARRIVDLQRLIVTMAKPVVTRLHGAVRAGGIGIVAASDIAIAADEATFALTEVKLGLAAAIISLTVHHRMNPRAAALTTLGGEVFGGAEAAAYGLVTTAVPGDDLDAEVARVCASLATGAPQGLRESKRILNRGPGRADRRARRGDGGAERRGCSPPTRRARRWPRSCRGRGSGPDGRPGDHGGRFPHAGYVPPDPLMAADGGG